MGMLSGAPPERLTEEFYHKRQDLSTFFSKTEAEKNMFYFNVCFRRVILNISGMIPIQNLRKKAYRICYFPKKPSFFRKCVASSH